MAIQKNSRMTYEEFLTYIVPSGVCDNDGKATSIPAEWRANATYNTGTNKANNNTTCGWIVGNTNNYANATTQIDLVNICRNYLAANGYNLKNKIMNTSDMIKIQSMLIYLIQQNCNKFYILGNPAGYVMKDNTSGQDVPECTGNPRQYTSPIVYVSRNNNPGTNVPTIDPNNFNSKKKTKVTPEILQQMKALILSYLNAASTITISTSYCHTNCYCHNCCCSSTCGGGKWL